MCLKFPKARNILKDKALKYTDVRKSFLLDTIKLCPFFAPLSNRSLSEVLYSLPAKMFEENSFMYKEGDDCEFIGFITEGVAEVYTYLNESKWTSAPTISFFQQTSTFIRRHNRIRRTSIDYFHKRPHDRSIVKMSIDELGPGSVLCSNGTLLREKGRFFAKVSELTVVLTLSQELLSVLMNTNSEIHNVVTAYRTKITGRNKWAQQKRTHLLAVDFEKKVKIEAAKSLFATRMKVKRAIMTKILEKRRLKAKGVDLQTMVTKLRAILDAEKTRDVRMMEKIRRGVAPDERHLIDAYDMLELNEVENPLLTQFAVHAAKVSSLVLQTKSKATNVSLDLDSIESHILRSKKRVESMKELFLLLIRLVDNGRGIQP